MPQLQRQAQPAKKLLQIKKTPANIIDILAKLTSIPGAVFEKPESKMESNNGNASSKLITSAKAIQEYEQKFFVINDAQETGAANRLLWESS